MQSIRRSFALLSLCLLTGFGAGCSRIRKYRAQDSPLPNLPTLAGKDRPATKPLAQSGRKRRLPGAAVAWSGEPNTAQPKANLAATQDSPRTTPADIRKIRDLVKSGRDRLSKAETYQVAMNRQERVGSSLLPAEDVLLSIRRNPKAVRLEWPSGSHKGREVIYSSSIAGGMMYINMADSMVPMPRITMAPDSPMVMKNSRHPITEAGLDAILDQLDVTLKSHETGKAAGETLTYDGVVTPTEIGRPCHKITRSTARGDVWVIALDAETCLPATVQENSSGGVLLEKYVFRNLSMDPASLAQNAAFDPDGRWGASKGLLGRFAQSGAASPAVR